MKNVIAILAFLMGSVSYAAPALQSLDCLMSNGVFISTSEVELDGLSVVTEWGGITKNFKAVLEPNPADGKPKIMLLNAKGEADYFIYLPLNKRMKKMQTLNGTVAAPDLFVPGLIRIVGGISCDVVLVRR
ncbi:MAG: hypothetical protein AABZ31_00350 [Bdellovibrionota bacterium]